MAIDVWRGCDRAPSDVRTATGVHNGTLIQQLVWKRNNAGTSGKVNADERDIRVFGSMPEFLGRKVTTSLNVFRTQDLSDETELVDYWGGTIQQQWKLRNNYLLSYDYSYKKFVPAPGISMTRIRSWMIFRESQSLVSM